MSRLRKDAADGPPPAADSLPGGGSLAGKPRRPPLARAARFVRTRPVTAAVLALLAALAALAAAGAARLVARAVGAAPARDPAAAADAVAAFAARAGEPARAADEAAGGAGVGMGVGMGGGVAAHEAAEAAAAAAAPPRGVVETDVASGGCHRKFEPGFLDSNATVCVTDEFFFDIALDEQKLGRMVVGVFGQLLPKSAANFRALATCTGAFSDLAKCFRGDTFHRVVPDFVIQGCSKATGTSIYGPTFREERSAEQHAFLSHVQKGAVSWAEYPIGSQWFVLTGRQSAYLDKNHALFGFVTEGMDVLDKLAAVPVDGDKPRMKITIIDSGDLHGHH